MRSFSIHTILNIGIAAVWLINGLYCKVLGLVPRHQQIVATLVGNSSAPMMTIVIGVAEICMAVWVLSGLFSRTNAIIQIIVVLMMNIIEFVLVPELLLWGRLNILFALVFVSVVYYNTFYLGKSTKA